MTKNEEGMVLSEAMVFQKTHQQNLKDVKNLNMWGYNFADIGIISKMPNLEIVSLSVNNIKHLEAFSHCPKLREIFLRNNKISDFNEIKYLSNLPNLRTIWLSENPISFDSNYRNRVIQYLPQITKLDEAEITEAERKGFGKTNPVQSPRSTHIAAQSFPDASPPAHNEPPARPVRRPQPPPQQRISSTRGERDEPLLTAVLALLPELSPPSLQIVLQTIQDLSQNK